LTSDPSMKFTATCAIIVYLATGICAKDCTCSKIVTTTTTTNGTTSKSTITTSTVFSTGVISDSVETAYTKNPSPSNARTYPHIYSNRESITFSWCTPTTITTTTSTSTVTRLQSYVEYPLASPVYPATSTKSPGAYRLVYLEGAAKSQCGCMMHGSNQAFTICTLGSPTALLTQPTGLLVQNKNHAGGNGSGSREISDALGAAQQRFFNLDVPTKTCV